jgi:K+-transporting ATPase ATPase C chain
MNTILMAIRTTIITLVLTGLAYPLLVTGLGQFLFSHRASGSLLRDDRGQVIGSEIIGQRFQHPAYFWGRPSAAGAEGYDAAASGGSNLGPTAQALRDRAAAAVARLRAADPHNAAPLPAELVTASASGLDPHLSPAAARFQVPRVARARGVSSERVQAVMEAEVEGRDLGFLGEKRVNVLRLNLTLDRLFGSPEARE